MYTKDQRLLERWITKHVTLYKWEKAWQILRFSPFDGFDFEVREATEELNEVEYRVRVDMKGDIKVSKQLGAYLLGHDLSILPSDVLNELGVDVEEILAEVDGEYR